MPVRVLNFTEAVAGVTYTASTSMPKGARLLDVLVETTVAWSAATAPVDVGDADGADSLIGAENIAAQDGKAAANLGGTDWGNGLGDSDGPQSAGGPGKLYPNGDSIVAVCSPTVPGGPTGVSRITLLYEFAGTTRAAVVA